jgi:uncharacterized protein (DUF1778 family)
MPYERFIGVRVLNSTKDFVEAAADTKGQSLSDFVRNSIIRDARMTLGNVLREDVEDE